MRQPIGGLEINDTMIRCVFIERGVPREIAVRLASGVVSGGVIQNKVALVAALQQLHADIQRTFGASHIFRAAFARTVSVVATVSARNVYVQSFTLPYIAINKLEEAAQLNLRIISPLDSAKSYYDWHIIREEASNSTIELLGAFMVSDISDAYQSALRDANFSLVALEFIPLSIARVLHRSLSADVLKKPMVIVNAGVSGIDLMILRGGELYFNRYMPWPAASGDVLTRTIVAETQKVINYYFSKNGELIAQFFVIDGSDRNDITQALTIMQGAIEKFALPTVPADSLPAVGAAYRGLLSRRLDRLISLTSTGTEEDYHRDRLAYAMRLWRNGILTTLVVVLLVLVAVQGLLLSVARSAQQQLGVLPSKSILDNVTKLEETARAFNDLVAQALAAKARSQDWLPMFNQLWFTAGKTIIISRLHFSPEPGDLLVGGTGVSELEVINFKNRIAKTRGFSEVVLPLSQIVRDGNRVSFQISMKVRKG